MSAAQGGHGALMDAVYRRQRHIYDATRKYYLFGRDGLIDGLAPPPGGTVLEVACGTGRNLVRAANAYPKARFCGFDISPQMLETARGNLRKAGLSEKVTLAEGDATHFDPQALFGVGRFDRIFLSYCLSMIPDWQAALAEAARHLAPAGRIEIVDFGDGAGLPGAANAALGAWLAKFHVARRTELPQAARRVAEGLGGSARIRPLGRGYGVRITLLAPGSDAAGQAS